MRDFEEKYMLIQRDFPNKAGKLAQLLATQKRQIHNLTALAKKNKDVEAILLTSAETYDVGHELLGWMKEVLQGVLNDAEALKEGSQVRNSLKFQSAIVEEWLNSMDKPKA
jgi:hypothetical protein